MFFKKSPKAKTRKVTLRLSDEQRLELAGRYDHYQKKKTQLSRVQMLNCGRRITNEVRPQPDDVAECRWDYDVHEGTIIVTDTLSPEPSPAE